MGALNQEGDCICPAKRNLLKFSRPTSPGRGRTSCSTIQELYGLEYSGESIAIVALCHDLCKVGCYKKGFRNVKDDATGKWEKVPTYTFDDPLPYGHGEKSVYITNGFIRLTREEAMAIRWHMGFSGPEDNRMVGQALQKYPLAFALATADMEASYFLEGED